MSVPCKIPKSSGLLDTVDEFSLCAQGLVVVSVLTYLFGASSLGRETRALDRDERVCLVSVAK